MANSLGEKFLRSCGFAYEKIRGSNALKTEPTENALLYDSISNARNELERAVSAFNELTDDKAIDYASYNLLAARAKYSYLLKLAKEKNLSL